MILNINLRSRERVGGLAPHQTRAASGGEQCPNCRQIPSARMIIYRLEGQPCDVVRCGQCSFIHLYPVPTTAWLEHYYGDRSTQETGYYYTPADSAFYESILFDAKRKFSAARAHMGGLPVKARLLDIGCNSGAFVKAMADEGLIAMGTDYSAAAIDVGRTVFGVDLRAVGRDADPGGEFDIVSFWEVLEHVPDIDGFLIDAKARLKPGGYIIGSIPHWNSIARRIAGSRWNMITVPDHINYFTRSSLAQSFERNGLTPVFNGTIPFFATPHWTMGLRRWMHARRDAAKAPAVKAMWLAVIRALTQLKRISYEPSNALLCTWPAFADHLLFVARKP